MKRRLILIIVFLIVSLVFIVSLNMELTSAEESYDFEWDKDDIRNGENFKIKILFYDLEDKEYDVKLWIEDDKNLMSDRYDSGWKSGWYYINEIVKGPGNLSERVKLRIDDKYEDFKGEAELHFKIRDGEDIVRDIEVLEKKEDVDEIVSSTSKDVEEIIEENIDNEVDGVIVQEIIEKPIISAEIIKLGRINENIDVEEAEDIKMQVIYESKTEWVKIYSVYGFTLLCVALCVLIIWRKLE